MRQRCSEVLFSGWVATATERVLLEVADDKVTGYLGVRRRERGWGGLNGARRRGRGGRLPLPDLTSGPPPPRRRFPGCVCQREPSSPPPDWSGGRRRSSAARRSRAPIGGAPSCDPGKGLGRPSRTRIRDTCARGGANKLTFVCVFFF